MREAQAALAIQVLAARWVDGEAGTATDFAALEAAIDAVVAGEGDNPFLADAAHYARARLAYRQGKLAEAAGILKRLSRRHPAVREIPVVAEAIAKLEGERAQS